MTDNQSKERSSSRAAGYLFGRFGLLAVLACLLVAVWYGQMVIVVVLGLLISVAGISRLWSRCSLAGVSGERRLGERRIFPGEFIDFSLHLANRKLLPLPWIQMDDRLPPGLVPGGTTAPGGGGGTGLLRRATALLWYSGVNWKLRLCGRRRGYYTLGPMTLTSGDIFGFYPRSMTLPSLDHVIVYPKIYPVTQLGVPPLYPIGETKAELRIFEDPVRVIGVRDYRPQDSLRRIHWKASARHQNLQVKVFEPTTTLNAAIFLAVDSFVAAQGEVDDGEDFELGVSTAASLASHLMEKRSSVGLFVNSRLADSGQPVEVLPGSSTGQLIGLLEVLAKVTREASSPFDEFLPAARPHLPWGTTLIFVLSRPSPSLKAQLIGLKESRHRLMVLQVGEQSESEIAPALNWHKIHRPDGFTVNGAIV